MYEMSSFPLTMIFQRGRSTTNQIPMGGGHHLVEDVGDFSANYGDFEPIERGM